MTPKSAKRAFEEALSSFEGLTIRGESPNVENWSDAKCREHNGKHNEARARVLALYDAALAEAGACETCGGTGHIKIAYPLDAIGTYRDGLCPRCTHAPGVPARDEQGVVVCEGVVHGLSHLDGQRVSVIIRPLVAKAEEGR
jgi:hypothetical protein